MASATVEKTAEELRKEIAELQRQQWEVLLYAFFFLTPVSTLVSLPNPSLIALPLSQITERLRDPRGIRRSGPSAGPIGPRKRGGAVRPVR